MKIVFATNNPNKLAEIKALVPDSIEIISLKEIGCYDELPETRDTLEGNALQKAEYVVNKYQIPCFSDDTGLLVDALNGEPGVYSARYAGLENSSEKNMNKLLKNLEGQTNRSASFETVVALILNGQNHIFNGSVVGEITVEKLKAVIRKGTMNLELVPVLVGSAYKNKGVQCMLDAVVDYLPSPLDREVVTATDIKTKEEKDHGDLDPDPGDFLQPSWFRCPICSNYEMDRFLLDYGRYFLLPIGILFWTLFFIF